MKYHFLIRSAPQTEAATIAAQVVLSAQHKHDVISVFFYAEAATVFDDKKHPALNIWRKVSSTNTPLNICSAAIQEFNLTINDLKKTTGIEALEIAGLGSHIIDSQEADRVVEL